MLHTKLSDQYLDKCVCCIACSHNLHMVLSLSGTLNSEHRFVLSMYHFHSLKQHTSCCYYLMRKPATVTKTKSALSTFHWHNFLFWNQLKTGAVFRTAKNRIYWIMMRIHWPSQRKASLCFLLINLLFFFLLFYVFKTYVLRKLILITRLAYLELQILLTIIYFSKQSLVGKSLNWCSFYRFRFSKINSSKSQTCKGKLFYCAYLFL